MSWNGAGVFNRLFSWTADAAAGIDISSSRTDSDTNDIASNGFGNCLTRDGQGQATANLPMANFRHTGVGNGVNPTDYAALGQVQNGVALNWTTAGGTSDALTAIYTPALTALVDGQLCFLRAAASNATTTPTFAPNGLTAHTITKLGGSAVAIGDIAGNLTEIILRYNLANTRWELLNPATVTGTTFNAGTAGGTANAITVTDANFNNQDGYQLRFWAANSNSGAATLAVSGGTARAIVKDTTAGPVALTGSEITASNSVTVVWDNSNTEWHIVAPTVLIGAAQLLSSAMGFNAPVNLGLSASVGSNLLTVNLLGANGSNPSASNPVWIPFQTPSSNQATGVPTWVEVTSALSISTHTTGGSGDTLGTQNGVPFRLWIVAFNNAGTVVLALWQSGAGSSTTAINPPNESLVTSSTAFGTGTSAGIFYTPNGTTISNKAWRIIGYLDYESGVTTAGTYNTAPTRVVLFGPGIKKPGDIIQVQFVNGTSLAIVPTSACNLVKASGVAAVTSGAAASINVAFKRGGSALLTDTLANNGSASQTNNAFPFVIYDNPATSSSITYSYTAGSCTLQSANSTICLEEIMG